MRNKFKFIILILTLFFSTQVQAVVQNIQIEKNAIMGLNDCIKVALNNSPIVKKSIFNLDIAKSSVGVAKSAYFPSLTLGGTYNQAFGERNHNFQHCNSK